jgi:HlyD family secretion protein
MTEVASAAPGPTRAPLSSLKTARTGASLTRRRGRRWLVWAAVLVLLSALIGFLLAARKPEVQASSVMTAYPSAQFAQLAASGYVVAQRRAAVASKASGRLVELRVREGSPVKAGALIARLDASDVDAAILAARAGIRQGEASLAQAAAGLTQAQVELANAEAELQRTLGLQAQNFVSAQAVDAARRRADAARAGVASARAGIAAAQGAQALAAPQLKVLVKLPKRSSLGKLRRRFSRRSYRKSPSNC